MTKGDDYQRVLTKFLAVVDRCIPSHLRGSGEKTARSDFEALCARREVLGVNVQEDALFIHRSSVVMYDASQIAHTIGKYMIKVTSSAMPTFYNLTHQVNGYHGPHINTTGELCVASDDKASVMAQLKDGRLALVGIWAVDTVAIYVEGNAFAGATPEMWPLL